MTICSATDVRAEKIVFSGRDGRTVRFDFSRQKSLLPPELDEKRLDQARPEGPAAFIPLVDPSYSPNSATRRKISKKIRKARDWIFDGTEARDEKERNREPRLFDDADEETSMMKFMRDGDDGRDKSDDEKDIGDSESSDRKNNSRNFDRNGNPMESQRLGMTPNGRDPLFHGLKLSPDLNGAQGGDQTFTKLMANELRTQGNVQHREKMSVFRDRFNNPFAASKTTAGDSVFGGAPRPAGEQLSGVTVSFGNLGSGGAMTSPSAPAFGPGASAPGVPNAFDTRRSMPIDFKTGPGFSEQRQEQRKRAPISLEIRKRDF